MKTTLIMMVGLPKSGKSTWARAQGVPIVNPDSIRLALHGRRYISEAEEFVWAIAHVMVGALFLAGHDTVILDACHGTKKRREFWVERYNPVQFQVMPVGAEECITRARKQGDELIVPVIERMAREWEPVDVIEGLDFIE